MKKLFFGLLFQLLFVMNIQAATYYSSSQGYWCLARNGKSYCFRSFPLNNVNDVFIVDRAINLKGDVVLQGQLIIEENGVLNITGDGNLEVEGSLEIQFAGILKVNGDLTFSQNSMISVARYSDINVSGNFLNLSNNGSVVVDGTMEIMGTIDNRGNISGLGKIIAPGTCVSAAEAQTFGQPGCAGINMFTLPVSLLSFEGQAKNNMIEIKWTTSKEENIEYFELQKANDTQFEPISIIAGKGEGASLSHYTFIDTRPGIGKNTYRLKSFDKNGSFEYHEAILVQFAPTGKKDISIFPNPLTGLQLQISLNFIPETTACISIINSQGKLCAKQVISTVLETIKIEAPLEPGLYIVLLEDQGTKLQQRLIIP